MRKKTQKVSVTYSQSKKLRDAIDQSVTGSECVQPVQRAGKLSRV